MSNCGPICMQDLLKLIAMSMLFNSVSHVCNKRSNVETEGEINSISSAHRIIWQPLVSITELQMSSIYRTNRIGERTKPV